ncbi:glycosyltransferase [Nitrospira sp. M1]
MSKPYRVLHITDALSAAGRERVVVNLLNHLPRVQCKVFLCTTRGDGPLEVELAQDIIKLKLRRRYLLDLKAIKHLVDFIREHDIQILHAHGPSLFIAMLASFFSPFPALLWHIHKGHLAFAKHTAWLYRLVARRIRGTITVNQNLAVWAHHKLHLPSNRVWYVPNFAWHNNGIRKATPLPGDAGFRIVCVANLRPPKDHMTQLHAMALVTQQITRAHLILVGSSIDIDYRNEMKKLIDNYGLEKNVSFLGQRNDVFNILDECDIGVLSSTSEGFPMTLIEYSMAKLPVVATQVGQCAELLDHGRAGILIPPGSPHQLAKEILSLLQTPEKKEFLGKQLNLFVQKEFNQERILGKICHAYEVVLND